MLDQKFLNWLRKQAVTKGQGEHGEYSDIAAATGLRAGHVRRLLLKQRRFEQMTLETVEQIARHQNVAVWQVLWMIEHGVASWPPQERGRT